MVPPSLVLLTFLCLAMRLSSNYLMALVSSPMVSPVLNYVTKTLELRVWWYAIPLSRDSALLLLPTPDSYVCIW
jgi:hypothetical protein